MNKNRPTTSNLSVKSYSCRNGQYWLMRTWTITFHWLIVFRFLSALVHLLTTTLNSPSQLEGLPFLGCVLRQREYLLSVATQRRPWSRAVCGAELQREAGGEGWPDLTVWPWQGDVRLWSRVQDPVCHPGPGWCLRPLRGKHLQVGLLRTPCPPPSPRRGCGGPGQVSALQPWSSGSPDRTDLPWASYWV